MSGPKSWCTVVPLINLDVGLRTPVYFAKGLWLTLIPDWLRQDTCVESLSSSDRETLKQLQYAFIVEYAASSSGAPDPEWNGPEPRSIQDAKHEIALLANLALWIARPSPVCFDLVFHAPRWEDGWNIQRGEKHARIWCHPKDRNTLLTDHDLDQAVRIHSALSTLQGKNAIWTAWHSIWTALQTRNLEMRELILWLALDALFGLRDAGEEGSQLAGRIAFFLSGDAEGAREIRQNAEMGYSLRRKIAHGHGVDRAHLSEVSHQTETLVRRVLFKILQDETALKEFCSWENRESYLDSLIPDS